MLERKEKKIAKRNSGLFVVFFISLFYALLKFSAHSPSMSKIHSIPLPFNRDHLLSILGIICGTVQYSWCKHNTSSWVSARVPSVNGPFVVIIIGHFRVSPSLCVKTRLKAQPLIWKWFFILMQIKLISTRKVVHLTSFWKLGFLELGSGLFLNNVWTFRDRW